MELREGRRGRGSFWVGSHLCPWVEGDLQGAHIHLSKPGRGCPSRYQVPVPSLWGQPCQGQRGDTQMLGVPCPGAPTTFSRQYPRQQEQLGKYISESLHSHPESRSRVVCFMTKRRSEFQPFFFFNFNFRWNLATC